MAILPQLTTAGKIAGHLLQSVNTNAVRTKVLPVVSQLFKENLLFSGPEMELMAIFLIDYKNTAVAAAQSAFLLTLEQFKSKQNPCGQINDTAFNNFQPCI